MRGCHLRHKSGTLLDSIHKVGASPAHKMKELAGARTVHELLGSIHLIPVLSLAQDQAWNRGSLGNMTSGKNTKFVMKALQEDRLGESN